MMFFQHFQREQMLEAQEMFRTSNIVTRPEKAVWLLDLKLPMQSVPITTGVVNSNLDQGEVYNIL
jgi:hypothetical protein